MHGGRHDGCLQESAYWCSLQVPEIARAYEAQRKLRRRHRRTNKKKRRGAARWRVSEGRLATPGAVRKLMASNGRSQEGVQRGGPGRTGRGGPGRHGKDWRGDVL